MRNIAEHEDVASEKVHEISGPIVANARQEFALFLESQMLKACRTEHDQQRVLASPPSDTNSHDDTSRGATKCDDDIDNDYSRSTSTEPPPDVKRARKRAIKLRVSQRSFSCGLRPSIETGDPTDQGQKKGECRLDPPKARKASPWSHFRPNTDRALRLIFGAADRWRWIAIQRQSPFAKNRFIIR
jgi:hypothetical protein